MRSDLSDLALIGAGIIGGVTALLHGVIMQRYMVRSVTNAVRTDRQISAATRRLISPLLHVSTLTWLLVGMLLIWAGARATAEPRWIAAGFGLVIYGYAAVANFVAVRAVHPGWILMSIATLLTAAGAR